MRGNLSIEQRICELAKVSRPGFYRSLLEKNAGSTGEAQFTLSGGVSWPKNAELLPIGLLGKRRSNFVPSPDPSLLGESARWFFRGGTQHGFRANDAARQRFANQLNRGFSYISATFRCRRFCSCQSIQEPQVSTRRKCEALNRSIHNS